MRLGRGHARLRNENLGAGTPPRIYRPELHGVRGLALLGVVLFHLFGNGRVSGGIDIFLAVTGFLFTGMLLRESTSRGGPIDVIGYLARLIRRILIPAVIVIAATLIAGLFIRPSVEYSQLWAEARASLLYFENLELINSQLAYGAAGPDTSPFQHFWSLSVQGQFYLVWPIVTVVAVLTAKALRVRAATVMLLFVGVIFALSMGEALRVGHFDQDAAYLMTTTRAWELAFGGVLALVGGTVNLPSRWRSAVGWVGVALVVTCGFFLDGAQLFPGPWALWPLLGFTLVMISSNPTPEPRIPAPWSAEHFLSSRFLAWIGDHAYGLYLWHWPLLVFYLEVRGYESLGVRGALLVLATTVILAILMYRLVETPLKNRHKRRPMGTTRKFHAIVVVSTTASLVIAGGVATAAIQKTSYEPQAENKEASWDFINYPGALSVEGSGIPEVDEFKPGISSLRHEKATIYSENCHQPQGDTPGTEIISVCDDLNKPADPQATIVLSGGSHSGHWYRAWEILAEKYNWELLFVNKDACVFKDIENADDTDLCQKWNDNYVEWLKVNDVDLVVTPGTGICQGE